MNGNGRIRHLIDSADWTMDEIEELWALTRKLKKRDPVDGVDDCLRRKTVILGFSHESTRSRLTFHQAVVEMGGVPIFVGEGDLHKKDIENVVDLGRAMAVSSSAICLPAIAVRGTALRPMRGNAQEYRAGS